MNDDLLEWLEFSIRSIFETEDSYVGWSIRVPRDESPRRHIFLEFFCGELNLVLWLVNVKILEGKG